MSVALFTHPDMIAHAPGAGHPERPERLSAVLAALDDSDLSLDRHAATEAAVADLERIHPAAYVTRMIEASPARGLAQLDADTVLSPGSVRAARLAAGAVIDAVRAVAEGQTARAFAAVRPPGHHAEPARAMGFCLFSNVAVAARVARTLGMDRVAVVDFDVHHGNGTQEAFEADDSLFLASIHQMPLYPGTGAPSETGVGNIVNVPVEPHAARESWRASFAGGLMPALDDFAPDLILISAGFDAHRRDPLAHQSLEPDDFAWATRAVLEVARRRCGGKVVSSLEGGYDLEGLGRSALAHVRALGEA
ncbi:histone deacetylase family protein [Brevundimonas subvibrioides]|uniref:histone deacetylase family protein n=1 Tax=Brevundimonas subvibrioides TaxID=74313 RepID=UPI0022B44D83|nr:histone deacetylase family protein [Brevundimonas subvibrioides]